MSLARDVVQNALDRRQAHLEDIEARIAAVEANLAALKAERQDSQSSIDELLQGIGKLNRP